jgi:DNA-binding Lrp family transcriptional regulator
MKLDATDKQILKFLQEDAKMTTKELAYRLGLTPTPIFERIKRLEKSGLIAKYVVILDKKIAGKNLTAFCTVSLKEHAREYIKEFAAEISKLPEVLECYHIAGMFDFMIKVVVEDMDMYHHFVYNKLASIDYIGNVRSSFVMSEIKNSTALSFE